jgi:hypothetical protein
LDFNASVFDAGDSLRNELHTVLLASTHIENLDGFRGLVFDHPRQARRSILNVDVIPFGTQVTQLDDRNSAIRIYLSQYIWYQVTVPVIGPDCVENPRHDPLSPSLGDPKIKLPLIREFRESIGVGWPDRSFLILRFIKPIVYAAGRSQYKLPARRSGGGVQYNLSPDGVGVIGLCRIPFAGRYVVDGRQMDNDLRPKALKSCTNTLGVTNVLHPKLKIMMLGWLGASRT